MGERYTDHRGTVISSNDLDMSSIKRQYIIEHKNADVIRAWQGHRHESKWMRCLAGSFTINLVKPLNIEKPTGKESIAVISLNADHNQILHIPGGYFTGIKSQTDHGMLQIFSDIPFADAGLDDFRQDADFWPFIRTEL